MNKTSGSGITFTGLLQITFIVLKLCKIINWNWIWVLAPTWISLILIIVLFIFICIIRR